MKVERKEKAFEPVVITLETQEELDAIRNLIKRSPIDSPILDNLHNELFSI